MKGRSLLSNFLLIAGSMFGAFPIFAQNSLPNPYSSDIPKNYVRTWVSVKPAVNPQTMSSELLKDVKQTTTYFDGLGRPLQAVAKQVSLETSTGLNADMVNSSL